MPAALTEWVWVPSLTVRVKLWSLSTWFLASLDCPVRRATKCNLPVGQAPRIEVDHIALAGHIPIGLKPPVC